MTDEMRKETAQREGPWPEYLQTRWDWLRQLRPDLLSNPDVIALRAWIEERIEQQPKMVVESEPLSDGKVWLALFTSEGEVLEIKRADEKFFAVEGRRVRKEFSDGKVFEWNQPVIMAKEEPTSFPTAKGTITLPVHGFLGVISDTQGRVLLRVEQELLSENQNYIDVVLAIQASASKIELIRKGDYEADRNLANLLAKLAGGEISSLLDRPDAVVPAAAEDPNRELKHNLYFFPNPIEAGSSFHEELVADGAHRWCSQAEVDALALTRLSNGHALSAIRTWEARFR